MFKLKERLIISDPAANLPGFLFCNLNYRHTLWYRQIPVCGAPFWWFIKHLTGIIPPHTVSVEKIRTISKKRQAAILITYVFPRFNNPQWYVRWVKKHPLEALCFSYAGEANKMLCDRAAVWALRVSVRSHIISTLWAARLRETKRLQRVFFINVHPTRMVERVVRHMIISRLVFSRNWGIFSKETWYVEVYAGQVPS